MKKNFEFLLDNYETFLLKDLINNAQLDYQMKNIIKEIIPNRIKAIINLSDENYLVEGSYGIGGYTYTPWIAIFDKGITNSAQRGFYIVILVKADLSGFYFSLNQGTTYISEKFKGHSPINKMIEIANLLRNEVEAPFSSETLKEIDLVSRTDNAKKYAAANIWAKYYPRENLPDSKTFEKDLIKIQESMDRIKELIGVRSLDAFIDDFLFKEEIDETKFMGEVHLSEASETERKPQPPAKKNNSTSGSSWVRNPKKAKEALQNANFKCEINDQHTTFISSTTKQNFVEAHHLIPINQQGSFKNGIDEPGNIVALCPNCHREIHFATKNVKQKTIKLLYSKKENDLKDFGIHIPLSDLYKMYGV